jgi:CheY-like chemotaxis protein
MVVTNQEKILVVDDEPHNVEALVDFLKRSYKSVTYVDCIEDAAEQLIAGEEKGVRFDAIISDNHFCQIVPGITSFDGVDFVNAVTGNYRTEESEQFSNEYFGSKAEDIENHYANRVVMFSGSAAKDRIHNPDLYEGIEVAQKFEDRQRVACERGVISILQSKGIAFEADEESIDQYKIEHDLQNGIKPEDSAHEDAVKAFLADKGIEL